MNTIKPGTRCEYRNAEHGQCKADAVRMVTVRDGTLNLGAGHGFMSIPCERAMCEACAEWHEKHNK